MFDFHPPCNLKKKQIQEVDGCKGYVKSPGFIWFSYAMQFSFKKTGLMGSLDSQKRIASSYYMMGSHILCNFLKKMSKGYAGLLSSQKKLDYLIWLPYVMKFSKGQLGSLPSQKGLYSPNLHLSFTRNTNFVKKNWSAGWSGSLGSPSLCLTYTRHTVFC